MIRFSYIFSLLLAIPGEKPRSEPKYAHYISSFVRDGAKRGVHIKRLDTTITSGFKGVYPDFGYCMFSFNRYIVLSERAWEAMTERGRMILAYHELGHCVLLRTHNDDPGSIMNEHIESIDLDRYTHEQLVDELFDKEKVGELLRQSKIEIETSS